MLELLVDCRLPLRQGDVIVAKISPGIWGTQEYKKFLIVQRDDPSIEQAIIAAGGTLSYPYATYDQEGNLTVQSTWTLDPGPLNIPNLSDTMLSIAVIPAAAASLLWIKKVSPPGLLGTAIDAISSMWNTITGWFS